MTGRRKGKKRNIYIDDGNINTMDNELKCDLKINAKNMKAIRDIKNAGWPEMRTYNDVITYLLELRK